MKTSKLFAVSIIAIMAVGAAHARIASTEYVDEGLELKQDVTNMVQSIGEGADDKYPSTAAVKAAIEKASTDTVTDLESQIDDIENDLGTAKSDISGLKTSKQDKLTAGDGIDSTKLNGTTPTITVQAVSGGGITVTEGGIKVTDDMFVKDTELDSKVTAAGYAKTADVTSKITEATSDMLTKTDAGNTYETKADATTKKTDLENQIGLKADKTEIAKMVTHNGKVGDGVHALVVADNGEITAHGTELATAANLQTVDKKITDLNDDVTALQSTVDGIESDLSTFESNIELDYVKKADVNVEANAGGNQNKGVVKTVTQTDGKIAVTKAEITNDDIAANANIDQSKISGLTGALAAKQANLTAGNGISETELAKNNVQVEAVDGGGITVEANGIKVTDGMFVKSTELDSKVTGAGYAKQTAVDAVKATADANKKAIEDMDLASTAQAGKVVTAISQTDGKVSATMGTINLADVDMTGVSGSETGVYVLTYSGTAGSGTWALENIGRSYGK